MGSLPRSSTEGSRSASVYVCEGIKVRLFPDTSFIENEGRSCGSRGEGADVRGVTGRTGDGSLGETPSGTDDRNDADVEDTAELESDCLR